MFVHAFEAENLWMLSQSALFHPNRLIRCPLAQSLNVHYQVWIRSSGAVNQIKLLGIYLLGNSWVVLQVEDLQIFLDVFGFSVYISTEWGP